MLTVLIVLAVVLVLVLALSQLRGGPARVIRRTTIVRRRPAVVRHVQVEPVVERRVVEEPVTERVVTERVVDGDAPPTRRVVE